MFVVLVQSFFLNQIGDTHLLVSGTGLTLQQAHEESFKAVFVGTLAIWTGFWIGTNLNAQLIKFLFREKIQALCQRSLFFSSLDKAAENHGLKILLLLRLCPIFYLSILIQVIALTGISYKNFVIGGFTACLPIMIELIQGTKIDSIEDLESNNYEQMKVYDAYLFMGTLVAIPLGIGTLAYYTIKQYR